MDMNSKKWCQNNFQIAQEVKIDKEGNDGKIHGLFMYCQIFISSSFSITRYFANNNTINKEFIFKWTDTHNLCKDGEELREQLEEGNLEVLKDSLEAIKQLQRQYLFVKIHPEFKDSDINISKKVLNDLKDVYKEVCKSLKGASEQNGEDEETIPIPLKFYQ